MKLKLQGEIRDFKQFVDGDTGKGAVIKVALRGVAGEGPPNSKGVHGELTFFLKDIIAEELKYGQKLFVTVDTEEKR